MLSFVASAIQTNPGPDKAANLDAAAARIAEAAADGARLVALPELFSWSGPQSAEASQAEAVDGPTSEFTARLAKRHAIHLVAGSILERADDGERCFNTTMLFAPDGSRLECYRKIHLFDVDIEGEVVARESSTRRSGDTVVCVDTDLGRIGLAICYDLRFPELFRHLADAGAEIIVMPSAFTAPTGAAHWHTLVRARAIENQCYVVAPNQFGPTIHGFASFGHSLIVDPWGEILADAGTAGPGVATARLAAERLGSVRRRLPSLEHRRLKQ